METSGNAHLLYIAGIGLSWIGFLWLGFRPVAGRKESSLWYGVVFAVLLIAGRWPGLFQPYELGVDESQMIAQAMKFLEGPVPWLSVDGTTSGPLNSYWLVPPALLGVPLGYASSRLMGLLAIWLFLWFNFLTARAHLGSRAALFLMAPLIAFLSLVRETEFIHYSSEHLPMALLSAQFFFADRIVRSLAGKNATRDRWILAVIAGAVPFSKLQATPMALAILAVAIAWDLGRAWTASDHRLQYTGFVRIVAPYCIGAIVVPILILGPVALSGAIRDFWISYVRLGFVYGNRVDNKLGFFLDLVHSGGIFTLFAYMAIAFSSMMLAAGILGYSWKRVGLTLPLFSAAFLAATIFALVRPGQLFPHYLLLLLGPLFCVMLVSATVANAGRSAFARSVIMIGGLSFAAVIISLCLTRRGPLAPWVNNAALQFAVIPRAEFQDILRLASVGESMSVWGWEPRLYVETGLVPGTRDTLTYGAITDGPDRAYYLERYVKDLSSRRPRIFLDAVHTGTFAFNDRSLYAHEQFPDLARFIEENYVFQREVGVPGDGYRIYLLGYPPEEPR